jgi:hypothetical protein
MFVFAWAVGAYENASSYSLMDLVLLAVSGIMALALGDTVFIQESFLHLACWKASMVTLEK